VVTNQKAFKTELSCISEINDLYHLTFCDECNFLREALVTSILSIAVIIDVFCHSLPIVVYGHIKVP
jgi:hypothetical protein